MPPRPYRMSRRQQAVDWRRAYMRAAARRVLRAPGSADFSLNAVARRAGVTRLTVYHQFGSRRGLLEALFDDLAARGGLYELPSAFREPDPETALERYIGLFGGVWTSARLVLRRLNAPAVLAPELAPALARRQEGRPQGPHVIAGRLAARGGPPHLALTPLSDATPRPPRPGETDPPPPGVGGQRADLPFLPRRRGDRPDRGL